MNELNEDIKKALEWAIKERDASSYWAETSPYPGISAIHSIKSTHLSRLIYCAEQYIKNEERQGR